MSANVFIEFIERGGQEIKIRLAFFAMSSINSIIQEHKI